MPTVHDPARRLVRAASYAAILAALTACTPPASSPLPTTAAPVVAVTPGP